MCHWNASFSPLSMPRNVGRGSLSLFQRDILPTQRNSACRVSDLPANTLQIALRFSKGAAGQGQDIVSDLPANALQIALRYSKEAAGQGQDICDLGEGGICAVRHVFFPEIFYKSPGASVHHEKQSSPCRMFVLFYVGGDTKKWAHAISSWEHLASWQPVLPAVPRTEMPRFCFPPCPPFRECEGQELLQHMI